MIGLPVNVANNDYLSVFDNAIENTLFSFGDNGGYVQEQALEPGNGYWLRFNEQYVQNISGQPISQFTIALNEGWNMVSGISFSVDANDILDPDDLILLNSIYVYDEGGYVSVDILEPGRGFWMRSLGSGTITLY